MPSAVRSQPANLLVHGGKYYLVDAGDGVSGQLARDADVGAVVITHFEGYDSDDPRHLEYHGTVSALYRGPVIIANDMDEF